MFTTSYKQKGFDEIISGLVKVLACKKIVELGTQQGHSAILLAKSGARVDTYDHFQEEYSQHPFKKTHANYEKALKNTKKYNIKVHKKDVFKVKGKSCDMLHIDICNHYDNVYPLLVEWHSKVKKAIILEGGGQNKWQKKYGFKPFNTLLSQQWLGEWNHVVIEGKGGYALTILTKK